MNWWHRSLERILNNKIDPTPSYVFYDAQADSLFTVRTILTESEIIMVTHSNDLHEETIVPLGWL